MNAANEGGGFGREDRVLALQTSAAALADQVKTHASGGGIPVQEVLPTAGDLLRRTRAASVDLGVVDQALSALSPAEVSKYLGSLELSDLAAQLSRAAEEAVEAGLAETKDEQELWSQSAADALFARDRAESVKVALERWTRLRSDDAKAAGAELFSRRLLELDRALSTKARTMTALNARRRTERDLLDAEHRAQAWWFTSRSDCDGLLQMLSGDRKPEGEHLEACRDCQRDLERARRIEQPPERHITSDEAFRFELGELSADERRRWKAHAEGCLECAQVFWAMDEGDKAIAELEAGAPAAGSFQQAASSTAATARQSLRTHRELARREAYRVVAIRGPRMRVLVQPHQGRGLAMAVMSIPPQRSIYEPRSTQEGLEFDLGEAKDVEGRTARLTVRVNEGGDNEVLDLPL